MRLLLTFAILALSVCEVHAQFTPPCTAPCTKSQLLNDVQTQFPDNTVGAITPSILRNFQTNLINSSMATAPVGAGTFTCYVGTTGLLGACTSALGLSLGGTGATAQPGAAAAIFPPPLRAGDVAYWNGSAWGTLAGNNIGNQVFSENASGAPSWVTAAVYPTPIRVGDVIYWSGAAWVALAGNNSGTQVLTEGPGGVPAWATYNAGTVTSVVAGAGLSGGSITTSGTIAINMPFFTNSLPNDIPIGTTFIDGPSVTQGATGTWYASGTVTLTDTAVAAFYCKLYDGTTVAASGATALATATTAISFGLSGVIAAPAGNIRIACRDSNTTGTMKFNTTGNSKDSTITVVRIQ
jgi:hypothetical protein